MRNTAKRPPRPPSLAAFFRRRKHSAHAFFLTIILISIITIFSIALDRRGHGHSVAGMQSLGRRGVSGPNESHENLEVRL